MICDIYPSFHHHMRNDMIGYNQSCTNFFFGLGYFKLAEIQASPSIAQMKQMKSMKSVTSDMMIWR